MHARVNATVINNMQLYATYVCMGTVLLLNNVHVTMDGVEVHVKMVSCVTVMSHI